MNKKSSNAEQFQKHEGYPYAGKRIMNLRQYLGMSRGEFGKRIGYSNSHIGRLEKGAAAVREDMIKVICDTFQVEASYFSVQEEPDVSQYIHFPDNDGLDVGVRLQKCREEKGYSQLYLADISGTNQSLISNVEHGKYRLFPKQAEKLADALGVGSEYLLTGDLRKKDYPVNDRMIRWLWEHKEERKKIWEEMKG